MGGLGIGAGNRVFSCADPKAVNRRMAAVCTQAKIERHYAPSAGRHSFGMNVMAVPGADLAAAMDAGGWKSAKPLWKHTLIVRTRAGSWRKVRSAERNDWHNFDAAGTA